MGLNCLFFPHCKCIFILGDMFSKQEVFFSHCWNEANKFTFRVWKCPAWGMWGGWGGMCSTGHLPVFSLGSLACWLFSLGRPLGLPGGTDCKTILCSKNECLQNLRDHPEHDPSLVTVYWFPQCWVSSVLSDWSWFLSLWDDTAMGIFLLVVCYFKTKEEDTSPLIKNLWKIHFISLCSFWKNRNSRTKQDRPC